MSIRANSFSSPLEWSIRITRLRRVGHPEVAARVVAQAMWVVDALTNGHESLERSRAQVQTQHASLDRDDREVPAGWIDIDPDGTWDTCHGRDAASRNEAPHDTVLEVGDVQPSGFVLGERGDLSEPCAQGRSAVSAESSLAGTCDSNEAVTLCVVPHNLMPPRVGDEDAALRVDVQAVRQSKARRFRRRQCNWDEDERKKEERSAHCKK